VNRDAFVTADDDTRTVYELHGEKMRFLFVGAFNTLFGYALFLAMLEVVSATLSLLSRVTTVPTVVSSNYFLIAQWTAWVLSVPVGTMTMKYFAFRSSGHLLGEIGRAYFVYLPMVAVSSGLLWFTVQVLNLSPAVGQLITIGIATVFSYLGHKHFTFRRGGGN